MKIWGIKSVVVCLCFYSQVFASTDICPEFALEKIPTGESFWYLRGYTNAGIDTEVYTDIKETDHCLQYYLNHVPINANNPQQILTHDGRSIFMRHGGALSLPVVGQENLQCADYVFFMLANYFYQLQADHPDIGFWSAQNSLGDRSFMTWKAWSLGHRYHWIRGEYLPEKNIVKSTDEKNLQAYLDKVYAFADTASMMLSLEPVDAQDIQPGDVFIRPKVGGKLGHVVLVSRVVEAQSTGERLFVLTEGNTPARTPHLVLNKAKRGHPDKKWQLWFSTEDQNVRASATYHWQQLYRFKRSSYDASTGQCLNTSTRRIEPIEPISTPLPLPSLSPDFSKPTAK